MPRELGFRAAAVRARGGNLKGCEAPRTPLTNLIQIKPLVSLRNGFVFNPPPPQLRRPLRQGLPRSPAERDLALVGTWGVT